MSAQSRNPGPTIAATAGSGTITSADGQVFEFRDSKSNPVSVRDVIISNVDASARLYVRMHADTANNSSSEWDFFVDPTQTVITPTSAAMSKVAIYSTAAVTYGTDFVVKGIV